MIVLCIFRERIYFTETDIRELNEFEHPHTVCDSLGVSVSSNDDHVLLAGVRTISKLRRLQQRFTFVLFSKTLQQYVCKHFLR